MNRKKDTNHTVLTRFIINEPKRVLPTNRTVDQGYSMETMATPGREKGEKLTGIRWEFIKV